MRRKNKPDISIDGDAPELFHLEVEDLAKTRRQLSDIVLATPLLPSKLQPGLYFKAENLQIAGSFKIRPALNQIIRLTGAEKKRGIVTSSSGNFAQGTAYAARCFGLSAKVVMMNSANPLKVEKARQLGAQVCFCENSFEARQRMVQEIRQREARTEIHPYDRAAVVIANATIAAEVLEQFAEVENVVVPVSGGGLIAGVASALKLLQPSVRVFGVQPRGSNATFLSFRQGRRVHIERPITVADGLMVTVPGKLTFSLIQQYVDDVFVVREESILAALRDLLLEEKLVAEPSAAVTFAAVREGHIPAEKTVCLLSGGNISADLLAELVGR